MTAEDLRFDPAKHVVNGKLRPPDKAEQRFIIHLVERGKMPQTRDCARMAVWMLYSEWYYGWRHRQKLSTVPETMLDNWASFQDYADKNPPEGW
jgi:hypothetical protein